MTIKPELTRLKALIAIKDAIDGLNVGDDIRLTAVNAAIDPTIDEDFPKFGIVAEPENITLGLIGSLKERNIRVSIVGYSYPLFLSPSGIGAAESSKLIESLFLTGEVILDKVIKKLTDPVVSDSFNRCTTGGGFSIVTIGPIVVDHMEFQTDIVFMATPVEIEFVES